MTDVAEHDYKLRFAALLQNVSKPDRMAYAIQVAQQVVGRQDAEKYPLQVVRIAEQWPHDPEVIAEIERLDAIPLSKEQWLRLVLNQATAKFGADKEQISALRLYGEGCGWLLRSAPVKEIVNPGEWAQKWTDMRSATTLTPVET